VLEARLAAARRRHHREVVQLLRQHRRRQLKPLVQRMLRLVELVTDRFALVAAQLLFRHQGLDVVAIALVRRYAPGRRMRLPDKALFLQTRHLIADGRRGKGDAVAPDYVL
jgi:hypothetical protein